MTAPAGRAAYWAGAQPLLLGMLTLAVPKCLDDLDGLPGESSQQTLRSWQENACQEITEHGDILQFPSPRRGESAKAFASLARGLAVMAANRGGVEFLGHVWCAAHSRSGRPGCYPCGECSAVAAPAMSPLSVRSVIDVPLPAEDGAL